LVEASLDALLFDEGVRDETAFYAWHEVIARESGLINYARRIAGDYRLRFLRGGLFLVFGFFLALEFRLAGVLFLLERFLGLAGGFRLGLLLLGHAINSLSKLKSVFIPRESNSLAVLSPKKRRMALDRSEKGNL
jgi:hypothetical protein